MNNWKQTTLGQIADIQTGPFGSQLHERDYVKEGTPIITVEHLNGDRINHAIDIRKVSDKDKLRLIRYTLEQGDIVYSRVGSVDRCALISASENGWMFSGRLLRVRTSNDTIDRPYLFYWLTQTKIKKYVCKIAVGATMPSLNTALLSSVPVLLPSLPEQKAIAAVLSSLDHKIDLLQSQNKALEKIAQTIFKHWFIDFEFPDQDGKPYKSSGGKMVDSELGPIPERWMAGVLNDEFEIEMGQSPKGESYNEQKRGMIFFQGRTDFGFRFPKVRLYTTAPQKIAEKYDTLVSVRAPVGDINMALEQCCIGRGLSAVRSKFQSYAYYKIKSLKGSLNKFEAEGTVFGALTKNDFNNIEAVVPAENLVESYEKATNPIDQKILNNHYQIQTLSRLRDTLLPKLMSGEVRVN